MRPVNIWVKAEREKSTLTRHLARCCPSSVPQIPLFGKYQLHRRGGSGGRRWREKEGWGWDAPYHICNILWSLMLDTYMGKLQWSSIKVMRKQSCCHPQSQVGFSSSPEKRCQIVFLCGCTTSNFEEKSSFLQNSISVGQARRPAECALSHSLDFDWFFIYRRCSFLTRWANSVGFVCFFAFRRKGLVLAYLHSSSHYGLCYQTYSRAPWDHGLSNMGMWETTEAQLLQRRCEWCCPPSCAIHCAIGTLQPLHITKHSSPSCPLEVTIGASKSILVRSNDNYYLQ